MSGRTIPLPIRNAGPLVTKKRTTYMLVELEGLSALQAAIALDIPEATVRTRLFHARRELHDQMDRPRRATHKTPGRELVHTDV